MTLYEIDSRIMDCVTVDEETGEAVCDIKQLEELQMERNRKLENIGCMIKNLRSDAAAIKAEIESLSKRKKAAEAQERRLVELLENALCGEKFKTARCEVKWRKSKSVNVTNPDLLPDLFWAVKREPSKSAITAAIKAGDTVPGAEMVERMSMSIK